MLLIQQITVRFDRFNEKGKWRQPEREKAMEKRHRMIGWMDK
jgi:hypothetical protein